MPRSAPLRRISNTLARDNEGALSARLDQATHLVKELNKAVGVIIDGARPDAPEQEARSPAATTRTAAQAVHQLVPADASASASASTPHTLPRETDGCAPVTKVEVGVNTHTAQLPTARCCVWLDVPFQCKDMAKALGAKWDDEETAWYVPPDTDLRPFAQWIAGNKVFLGQPFDRNDEVKGLGARFDKKRKRWFVGTHNDLKPFEQWLPARLPPGAWNGGKMAAVAAAQPNGCGAA